MICGLTGLAVIGAALPKALEAEARQAIHIWLPPAAGRGPRREGLVAHRDLAVPTPWISSGRPTRIANPVYCWAQVTRELTTSHPWSRDHERAPTPRGLFLDPGKRRFLEAVQIGDGLMRRQAPLVDESAFDDVIAGFGRRPGVRAIREVANQVRARTDSLTETWARLIVWDAGFPAPQVNYEVKVARRSRFLDLAWPEPKIALEFQGRQHFDDPTEAFKDFQRRGQLGALGWLIVEAAYGDLNSPESLIQRLAAAFAARVK
ncbi:MAG: hypothetical protein LBD90_09065 [Bifidobacteriaceae bacterium]|nr:hypothetical protein [Bifidobacteriaceae bacterium]